MKKMLTEEKLKTSKEFKDWVSGKVSLIHNTYYDSDEPYAAFIVIHSNNDKWTITRFFELGGDTKLNEPKKIQVSVDHDKITSEQVFKVLLTQYSRGLK